jgi:hypothetical protein
MTREELDIVKQLSILGKRIKQLPEIYEDPENELSSQVFLHINALERIVFAREGLRAYTKVAAGELLAKLEADVLRNPFTPVISIPKKKQTAKKKKSPGRPAKKKKSPGRPAKKKKSPGRPAKKKKVKKVPAGMTRKELNQLTRSLVKKKPGKKGVRKPFSVHPA